MARFARALKLIGGNGALRYDRRISCTCRWPPPLRARHHAYGGHLAELRVKESDRLAAVEVGLREPMALRVEAGTDWSERVTGAPGRQRHCRSHCRRGHVFTTHDDHRIAMAFLVMSRSGRTQKSCDASTIRAMIATSFPEFFRFAMAGIRSADLASEPVDYCCGRARRLRQGHIGAPPGSTF